MKAEYCFPCAWSHMDGDVMRCSRTNANNKQVRYIHKCQQRDLSQTIIYSGRVYQVLPFTNDHPHIEPCGECAFGTKVDLGLKKIIDHGREKWVHEGGWGCKRPKDFEHCTCIHRPDNRNVYFRLLKITHNIPTDER